MNREKKIVMLGTHVDGCGGIASVIAVYRAAGLLARRDIVYLPTHRTGPGRAKVHLFALALLATLRLLARGEVALLHVHVAINASFWRKYVFFLLGYLCRVPVALHLHAGRYPDYYRNGCGPLARLLMRFAFDRVRAVVVVSGELQAWVRTVSSQDRVVVLHNPVLLPQRAHGVAPAARPARARAPATLLFLGHLEAGKGCHDLLRAMRTIVAAVPQARLLLCGDGQRDEARALIAALGLQANVDLPGWVDAGERAALLDAATVFVLPSHAEGLPMSLLEAMAHGVPVVATAVGGIPEAVRDGVEGVLVAPGDTAALADAVLGLLADPAARLRLGAAGRERVRTEFSSTRMIATLEDLYEKLAAREARRPGRRERFDEKIG
ncbi:glycosyltransferase family 4 protein [Massilia oculi]|uniref:glycosyltransferase family 4 protein n=1 Tax=Massilia oculi TaxID=945844 RepID=UPI001AAF91EB|nr:glycosyltransferase family 4 protein [Massilia oculi]